VSAQCRAAAEFFAATPVVCFRFLQSCFANVPSAFCTVASPVSSLIAIVVMWAVVAIVLFLSTPHKAPTPIPVWRSCQIGRLECLEAAFFDQCYELIAIFVIAFCLFLWILGPKTKHGNLWHMRQAPDAVFQMRQVVGEDQRKKHVAHVLFSPSFAQERPILLASLSRSEGSLALQSQKSERPIVDASISRSTGSLVQQGQKLARSHSPTSNLRRVLQGQKLALSHFPESRIRRQEQATIYSSGTHFYKHVIANQSVK